MIKSIRTSSQQLVEPVFEAPKDIVSWMGAIQAQDYNMAKWAVAIRSKSAVLDDVEEAIRQGEILRTHILRPTWHFVSAEDIRWMLKLSARRIIAANKSYGKDLKISDELNLKVIQLIEKMLEGNKSMTRQQIVAELTRFGITIDTSRINWFLLNAEAEGIICNGIDINKKPTYALLEERVRPAKELHKEEALAKLAKKYFSSHSPASLQDFVWWSGLAISEAKQAIGLIDKELITDKFESCQMYVHESCRELSCEDVFHFLPSYDEYLISYKDRTDVLNLDHYSKAFNNYGIFYPVIVHNGKVVGNWTKSVKKGQVEIETSFFDKKTKVRKDLIKKAEGKYKSFIS